MKQALFMLRTRKNGPAYVGETGNRCHFANKQDAKAYRNQLREKNPDSTVVVSYGPDHRLFKGE
jgi:hypothetical protein